MLIAPASAVSVQRNDLGKAALGLLSALLVALLSWGAHTLWATKLDVDSYMSDYHKHLQQDALNQQLDSVYRAQTSRQMHEVLCAVKPQSQRCRS